MLTNWIPAARGNTAGLRTGLTAELNYAEWGNIRLWYLVLTFGMNENNEDNCHGVVFFTFHCVHFHKHCSHERSQHIPPTITVPSVFNVLLFHSTIHHNCPTASLQHRVHWHNGRHDVPSVSQELLGDTTLFSDQYSVAHEWEHLYSRDSVFVTAQWVCLCEFS